MNNLIDQGKVQGFLGFFCLSLSAIRKQYLMIKSEYFKNSFFNQK